ncbi:MAG: uracil-DNA glycosylase [Bacteroidia bacterium]|nr:uracil-DNA glycosylase [Bacteroidia bacterium]MCX7764259.1 uracil-DNA glycosylase [Bacteroidia bacterium]MDW8057682.1 uracil-DNA glycosylase [Bacteroidia bacterium]
MAEVAIEPSWKRLLEEEFNKPYFEALVAFLKDEKRKGKVIYPPGKQIFRAFELCPPDQVKVVILGQDPYHGPGQAHGLCFSVPKGVPPPPSLQNIFKEIQDDLGLPPPPHGDLTGWAEQGVFLLNAILTVEAHKPASHRQKGWEIFTDRVIQIISEIRPHVVFLLWGQYARSKKPLIDARRHLILEAAHPSPYSAANGFFGCRHFSKANAFLIEHGMEPIDWGRL